MTPKEFIEYRDLLRKHIESLEEGIGAAYESAATCSLPANLRPATPSDIVIGNVIWYTDTDEGSARWCAVDEVLNPSDKWKAYLWDGARYGLDNAYVEVQS